MAAKELGNKFLCFKCNTKFYDLKKPDPICPKCGADQRESPANRPSEGRRGRLAAVPKAVVAVEPEEPAVEADEEADDFDDEEEVATEEDT
ncbi:MAG: FYDLN acid domain-containing protein [Myxococcaceae bacterium]|nr:FYDLN acid domain-containing protein [Myxococcaceae bacterium]